MEVYSMQTPDLDFSDQIQKAKANRIVLNQKSSAEFVKWWLHPKALNFIPTCDPELVLVDFSSESYQFARQF